MRSGCRVYFSLRQLYIGSLNYWLLARNYTKRREILLQWSLLCATRAASGFSGPSLASSTVTNSSVPQGADG
ncbi:hypothetical protein F4825DRAFT_451288 [Nemania diffusa]|nr:hypothetical protein F4825DRAFT_451288 [Nemania diffusa]